MSPLASGMNFATNRLCAKPTLFMHPLQEEYRCPCRWHWAKLIKPAGEMSPLVLPLQRTLQRRPSKKNSCPCRWHWAKTCRGHVLCCLWNLLCKEDQPYLCTHCRKNSCPCRRHWAKLIKPAGDMSLLALLSLCFYVYTPTCLFIYTHNIH